MSNNYFELLKKFTIHSGQLMEAIKDLPAMQEDGNKRHLLTPIHKLNIDINSKLVALSDIKEDLRKIIVFLRRIPAKKFYQENDISELDYLKYHLEVFFHKVATGSDLMKLLVNIVFELQLDNRSCTMQNLRKKVPPEHHQTFLKLIEAYDETFRTIKIFRNKNSHEAKFYDGEFEQLSTFDNLYRWHNNYDAKDEAFAILMPRGYLEFKIKELRKARIKWIASAIDAYKMYIDKIMENSILIYFEKFKLYTNNNAQLK